MATTVMTIKITTEQKENLRKIAKSYGFTIGRGKEKDWGSVRKLMAAIADEQLHVFKLGGNSR